MKRNGFFLYSVQQNTLPFMEYSTETTRFFFRSALVTAVKEFNDSFVHRIVVTALIPSHGSYDRYIRTFLDIRDYAVFHTRLLICKDTNDLLKTLDFFGFR